MFKQIRLLRPLGLLFYILGSICIMRKRFKRRLRHGMLILCGFTLYLYLTPIHSGGLSDWLLLLQCRVSGDSRAATTWNFLQDQIQDGALLTSTKVGRRSAAPTYLGDCAAGLSDLRRFHALHNQSHYLTIGIQGRLGNAMFEYASMVGIARRNSMMPCIPADVPMLTAAFRITAKVCHDTSTWPAFGERYACSYDNRTELLNNAGNVELMGFFQSWRYFRDIERDLRRELKFHQQILEVAEIYVADVMHKYFPETSRRDVIIVGVHVRRSDMLKDYNEDLGYTVADRDYLDKAMSHFERLFGSRRLLFIVCSDDVVWSQENILPRRGSRLEFSTALSDVEDLALLSLCDHTVITVGTFGWWGAWLAGGNVTYFSDFPRAGSYLDELFSRDDYYKTNWIPF